MTIVLPLSEVLLILYTIIDCYWFSRIIEIRYQQEFAFFERLASIEADCGFDQAEVSSLVHKPLKKKDEQPKATLSMIDEAAEDLLKTINHELGLNIQTEFENDFENCSYLEEEIEYDDYLSIHDAAIPNESTIDSTFKQYATAKIGDNTDGQQQWIVKVIGIEGEYIHVTDGNRIWVKVGEQKASKIKNGDVLDLDVIRNGRNIEVIHIFKLETSVSEDYCIPDEMDTLMFEEEKIAI
jgi:hypothetical protein